LLRVKATHGACGEHFRDTLGEVFRDETGCHSADDFDSFFKDKVNGVRASLLRRPSMMYHAEPCTPTLEDWTAVTAEEIQKLISSAPNKTCELVPAPHVVGGDAGTFSPFISLLFQKITDRGLLSSDIQGKFLSGRC